MTLQIVRLPLSSLKQDPKNARKHGERNLDAIRSSLQRFGQRTPLVVRPDGTIIGGNATARCLADIGETEADAVVFEGTDAEAAALGVALNRSGEFAEWDPANLADVLRGLDSGLQSAAGFLEDEVARALAEFDVAAASASVPPMDDAGLEGTPPAPPRVPLAQRFGAPPFSVLNARAGYWQGRKEEWLRLGIKSEEGRPGNLLQMSEQALTGYGRNQVSMSQPRTLSGGAVPDFYYRKSEYEKEHGPIATADFEALMKKNRNLGDEYEGGDAWGASGTSIFDPVLAELCYRWWCPPGGRILDPFAGGSVRGIVAAKCGFDYTGIDLRPEQVAANKKQADEILTAEERARCRWIVGDSEVVLSDPRAFIEPPNDSFDFVFSCPPYYDLELYSDNPTDLSNAESYEKFLTAYGAIIAGAVRLLAPNRFAAFVVGDIRDPRGLMRGFPHDTVRAFGAAGADFYMDAVLVQPVGSAALRAARNFVKRKLTRVHQEVLVFARGEPWTTELFAPTIDSVDLPAEPSAEPAIEPEP